MTWDVGVKPSAANEIRELPDAAKRDVGKLLRALYESPIELADTVLEGHENIYATRFHGGRYQFSVSGRAASPTRDCNRIGSNERGRGYATSSPTQPGRLDGCPPSKIIRRVLGKGRPVCKARW